jgi:glycosyltransferase involved in cell wall biosynthesis
MKLRIEKSVCVITPSVGKDGLTKAIDSVSNQTYKNIKHLVVADGNEYLQSVLLNMPAKFSERNISLTVAPQNTGAGGMYGHRIYAAYPHLVDADYILFLDDDNWWDENHVQSLVDLCEEKNLDFAYSLRKVYVGDKYLADDCCEAIGRWPIAWSDGTQHLVDTSSYCFKREWLINVCQIWHYGWGGDRRFFMFVRHQSNYDTTGLHTLNYILPDMDKAYGGDYDIFKKGNELMKQKHNGVFPWQK